MTRKGQTIDTYLAGLPDDKRLALARLRKLIHAAAPGAEECFSYGLPGFRFGGRHLVWFGAAAKHCSFYPGTVLKGFDKELRDYDTSKGTVRFQADNPLPAALVRKIVKARIAQNAIPRRVAVRRTSR